MACAQVDHADPPLRAWSVYDPSGSQGRKRKMESVNCAKLAADVRARIGRKGGQ